MRSSSDSFRMVLLAGTLFCAAPILRTPAGAADEDPLEPHFNHLVPAASWLERSVADADDKQLGVVRDLALDLETGHVALAIVEIKGSDEQTESCLAVPPVLLEDQKGQTLRLERSTEGRPLPLAELARSLDRGFAKNQYAAFGLKPYWSVPKSGKAAAKPEAAPLDDHDALTLLTQLEAVTVVDKDAHPLGPLMGFSFSPASGRIAYAALRLSEADSKKLLPIPLSAFVASRRASHAHGSSGDGSSWELEIPKDIVEKTPGFDEGNWPTKLERAWVEYTHVRYGRSPLGGVRHTTKAERDAEAK